MPRKKKSEEEVKIPESAVGDPDKLEENFHKRGLTRTVSEVLKILYGDVSKYVKDAVELGRELKQKYDILAKELGYSDTFEFIDTAVNFFLDNVERVTEIEEELRMLRAENSVLKLIAKRELHRALIIKAKIDTLKLALMNGYSPKEIEALLKLVDVSLGDADAVTREAEEGLRRIGEVVRALARENEKDGSNDRGSSEEGELKLKSSEGGEEDGFGAA